MADSLVKQYITEILRVFVTRPKAMWRWSPCSNTNKRHTFRSGSDFMLLWIQCRQTSVRGGGGGGGGEEEGGAHTQSWQTRFTSGWHFYLDAFAPELLAIQMTNVVCGVIHVHTWSSCRRCCSTASIQPRAWWVWTCRGENSQEYQVWECWPSAPTGRCPMQSSSGITAVTCTSNNFSDMHQH